MKVKVNEKGNNKEFPKLMKGTLGTIVLMTSYGSGFVIKSVKPSDSGYEQFGEFYDRWQMEFFKDFEGSITLSDD